MKIIIGKQNEWLKSTQDKVEVSRPGAEDCGALGEPGAVTVERREGRGVCAPCEQQQGPSAKQRRPSPGEKEP